MKKCRKFVALLMALTAVGAMSAGLAACGGDPDPGHREEQPTEAEKLKDGSAIVFTDGKATIDLAQYVKANGNEIRVASSNTNVATVALNGNTMTVTAKKEGSATITVRCGEVTLTFSVVAPKTYYTVTLDGSPVPPATGEKWESGSSYTLPAAATPTDENMEFKGWSVNGETKQAGASVTVDRNLTITAVFERKAAQEVAGHAESVTVGVGKTVSITISDYITAYGREVTASTEQSEYLEVNTQDGVVTVKGLAQGGATLKLATEGVTVEIGVTVVSAQMPTFANETITIDLFTEQSKGVTFAPDEPAGHTYSYEYTLAEPNARVSIASGALTFSAVDYDLDEDGEAVVLRVNAAVTIDGEAAGNVSFTVTVRVSDTTPAAPVFGNVTKTLDPFSGNEEENSYTLVLREADDDFTYSYEIGGTALTENKKYTAETEEIVKVTYVYKGNTAKSGTATFTVSLSYDESTFPALKQTEIEENIDLALSEGGVYSVDLFANFTNKNNIASYMVDGKAFVEGTEYTISNSENAYGETAVSVTYTVVAALKNDFGTPLQYIYTVNVTDTTAFRMENGGFEKADEHGKPTGWTGATGRLDTADTYWEKYSTNNDGKYYVGVDGDPVTDPEGGRETLTSAPFKIGGSGWITFKFGSARPLDGNTLRNVRLEFYKKDAEGGGVDSKIAEVRNILFVDPAAALKLNDYKLDLSGFRGDTVYAKAVDDECGGNFRSLYLDAFETYWKSAPTDEKYTDLTSTHYFNAAAEIDLKDTNTLTLNAPVLSQGLTANTATFTAEIDKAGLTADESNPLLLTATKAGAYTVTYKIDGETAFTVTVNVKNTAESPAFGNMTVSVKKGESGTLNLPAPETDSRFAYAYAVEEDGAASVEGSVLTYNATGKEEGTYSVTVTVTVTDIKWSAAGDTFEKTFTVEVTVFGEKIVASDLLSEGAAAMSADVYAIKQASSEATSLQIDFTKYLIIPEGVTVNYTVTRKIGGGEASAITLANGAYALPFADCALTVNQVETIVFAVAATNAADAENTVSFTLTLSIKDTTQNRVVNGGFETGDITGWTLDYTDGAEPWDGNPVQNNDGYWGGKAVYNKSGVYHFNGQEGGIPENRKFTLTSSSFVLGGSGFITFKLGGRAAVIKVYMLENGTEKQIAEYGNSAYADHDITHIHLGAMQATMTTYVADLSQYIGKELKLVLCDDLEGGWGHSILDEVITYYETELDAEGKFDTVKNLCEHTPEDMAEIGETCQIPWKTAENTYVEPEPTPDPEPEA